MNHFTFVVNDEPYSLWDPDPSKRTAEFLDSIDPGYFSYLAESHATQLEEPAHKRHVATAARMAYLHGVETLMTLAAAAVQAPQAPYAWICLAKTDLLRKVVERITSSDHTLHSELLHWDRTWEGLANSVFSFCGQENGWSTTAEAFGRVWRIFAHEFLNEINQQEYNSLKHGFRIRSSGVKISVGRQKEPDVAAAREDMKHLGGSETGSTFYSIERAGPDVPGSRSKRTIRRTANWESEPMIRGLQILDVSIRNLVTFMRIANGAQPSTLQFHRLEGIDDLAGLLDDSVGVRTASFQTFIPDTDIPVTTKSELLVELEKVFSQKN